MTKRSINTILACPLRVKKKSSDAIFKTTRFNEIPPSASSHEAPVATNNKTPVVILSILVVVFLATTIWQYLQKNQINTVPRSTQIDTPVKKPAGKLEIKLQAAIDQANGHILILSDTAYPTPILISDAIQISKDSLLIKAKGKIVLQSDSGYTGPAFQLSSKCKNIVLDSLILMNFQTGIASFNDAVSLRYTRFIGCQAAVQNAFTFADKKYISGKMPAALFRADSIPSIKK